MLFCRFSSNHPFIAYFLKKNYSLRQNIFFKKIEGLRGQSYQSQLVFIWILSKLRLDWEQAARRTLKNCCKGVIGRWTELCSPMSSQFIGGELLLRRSDRTLKQCSPSVRSEGDPASDQAKMMKTGSTGLWLCLISWDRT